MSVYLLVLVIIVAALLAVSLTRLRSVKTGADFLVAGRSLSAGVLIFTLLSSWIGAGSLFAGAENAFRNGMAALWQPAGGWVGLAIIYFVAPRARKFAQFTVPDLLEARYGAATRILGMIAIILAFTAITSYQFKGGGDILALSTGISPVRGTAIIAGFVILFTALAGMSSIAYVDLVIGLLVTVTLIIAIPVLLAYAGGWAHIRASLPENHFAFLGPLSIWKALAYFLPVFLLMLGNQSMYQKFFSAKSEGDARRAVVGWVIGTVILETLIVVIAVIGSALFNSAPDIKPREIIPYTARHGLPSLLGAVLMGAVFAKVISTGNNYLFSPATNIVHDIYSRFINPTASSRRVLVVSRLVVVLLGIFAFAQTFQESILAVMLYAYTVYSAAITPVVMAAFFWKRATRQAAVFSVAAGTVITVLWNLIPKLYGTPGPGQGATPPGWLATMINVDAIYPAVLVSVAALVIISLFTAPPPREQAELLS
jgi:SSS family solute:Na+ symporter/sodium/proline symporter